MAGKGPMRRGTQCVMGTWRCVVRAQHLPDADITTTSGHFLNLSVFISEMGGHNIHPTVLLGRFNKLFAVKLSGGAGTYSVLRRYVACVYVTLSVWAGCPNTLPYAEWLNQPALIASSSGGRKSVIKGLADAASGKNTLLLPQLLSFCCVFTRKRPGSSLGPLLQGH